MTYKTSRFIAFGLKQPLCFTSLWFILALISLVLSACDVNELSLPTSIPLPGINDEDERQLVQPTTVPDQSPRGGILIDLPPTWTPSAAPGTTPVAPSATTSAANADISTQTYIVQVGDTLAEIAIQFDISLSALAQANNIDDPDHIEAGQELIIPRQ